MQQNAGRRKWLLAAGVLLAAAAAALLIPALVLRRALPLGLNPSTEPPPNVVVITLDTVRADRVAPHASSGDTPTLARLAREGVTFTQAYTPAPLTLPSHCSIFTGLLPYTHGVRDNGGAALDDARETLAEMMKRRGYTTGAFVSAFVLDRRWGLAQGFDHYFDGFDVTPDDLGAMARVQRRADETSAEARRWLDTRGGALFFLWVHFFDPHSPYDPPEPFRARYAQQPYAGEIAYVDEVLGRLVADLERTGLLDRTLLVIVADHGEGLGEHDEDEHGLLAYDSTLRVPMILRLPRAQSAGTSIDHPVSLVDVLPTVLELSGFAPSAALDGTSRASLIRNPSSGSTDAVYSETYYPRLRFGWSELASVRVGGYKYIRAPQRELYDYRQDPEESTNLAARHPDIVERLDGILSRMTVQAARQSGRTVDPETVRRLAALGYVAGSPSPQPAGSTLPNPKTKTAVYRAFMHARRLLDEGKDNEGVTALKDVLRIDPALEPAHRTLREYWVSRQRLRDAAVWFETELARRPTDAQLLIDLGVIYRAARQKERAVAVLETAVREQPKRVDAMELLGQALREAGRAGDALSILTRAQDMAPEDLPTRMQLAQTLLVTSRLADAEAALDAVLRLDPRASGAHYLLAQVAEQRGDQAAAEREYRAEIQANPWDYQARFNLALLLSRRGEHREQIALLESIPKLAPGFHEAHFYLAKAILDSGDAARFDEAVRIARQALRLAPESPVAPLGHYVLADIYRLQGREGDSARELGLGRALEKRLAARAQQ